MRTGRPVPPLVLTSTERTQLNRWTHRRDDVSKLEARRAQIILAAAGPPPLRGDQVAARLNVSPQTVSLWRRRFVASRMAGLRRGGGAAGASPSPARAAERRRR